MLAGAGSPLRHGLSRDGIQWLQLKRRPSHRPYFSRAARRWPFRFHFPEAEGERRRGEACSTTPIRPAPRGPTPAGSRWTEIPLPLPRLAHPHHTHTHTFAFSSSSSSSCSSSSSWREREREKQRKRCWAWASRTAPPRTIWRSWWWRCAAPTGPFTRYQALGLGRVGLGLREGSGAWDGRRRRRRLLRRLRLRLLPAWRESGAPGQEGGVEAAAGPSPCPGGGNSAAGEMWPWGLELCGQWREGRPRPQRRPRAFAIVGRGGPGAVGAGEEAKGLRLGVGARRAGDGALLVKSLVFVAT